MQVQVWSHFIFSAILCYRYLHDLNFLEEENKRLRETEKPAQGHVSWDSAELGLASWSVQILLRAEAVTIFKLDFYFY